MISCPQHAFEGCPGETCERNCSARSFMRAEQIVAENARASQLELVLISSMIVVVMMCGLVAGNYALGREANAYKIERQ